MRYGSVARSEADLVGRGQRGIKAFDLTLVPVTHLATPEKLGGEWPNDPNNWSVEKRARLSFRFAYLDFVMVTLSRTTVQRLFLLHKINTVKVCLSF